MQTRLWFQRFTRKERTFMVAYFLKWYHKGDDPDFMARQLVDDAFRAGIANMPYKQGLVEQWLKYKMRLYEKGFPP